MTKRTAGMAIVKLVVGIVVLAVAVRFVTGILAALAYAGALIAVGFVLGLYTARRRRADVPQA